MISLPPKLQSALAFLRERLARLLAWAKRHPIRAALALPALLILYVLALIPFTPSIRDLTKAKSATPSVVISADGVVLAEFKRLNRQWVPLDKIAPQHDARRVNVVVVGVFGVRGIGTERTALRERAERELDRFLIVGGERVHLVPVGAHATPSRTPRRPHRRGGRGARRLHFTQKLVVLDSRSRACFG